MSGSSRVSYCNLVDSIIVSVTIQRASVELCPSDVPKKSTVHTFAVPWRRQEAGNLPDHQYYLCACAARPILDKLRKFGRTGSRIAYRSQKMSPTGYSQEIILKNVSSTSFEGVAQKISLPNKKHITFGDITHKCYINYNRYGLKLHFTVTCNRLHIPHVIWPICAEGCDWQMGVHED